ncbi:MAG: SDR family NAD(P)-dependent oxidoreductase [bacterium]
MTKSSFEGRSVLVTGGLSGIGRASCELLAAAGAMVIIFDKLDISRDDGVAGIELSSRLGNGSRFFQGDITSEEQVAGAFDLIREQVGNLDAVVNSAGVTAFKKIEEITRADYDLVMGVNVWGTFIACKNAMSMMKAQEAGVIVNVASNFGLVGGPEGSVYSASKGAVITLSKALAIEGAPYGIRVNALCPGATATEFNRAYLESRPDVVERWQQKTPLRIPGREDFLARREDIARAVLFLASDDSVYMTGAAMVVDGGWNAE